MKYYRPKLLKKMLPSNVNTSFVSDVKLRLSVTEINKVELSETKNNVNISSNVETSFPSDVKHRSSDTEINKVEPPKTKNIVNIIEQDGEKVNNRRHRLSYIGVNNLLGVSGRVLQEDFTDEEIGSFLNESMPGEESDEEKEIELSIYNTLTRFCTNTTSTLTPFLSRTCAPLSPSTATTELRGLSPPLSPSSSPTTLLSKACARLTTSL